MNQKIYQKILLDTQGDISRINTNYIKETFGFELLELYRDTCGEED